MSSAPVLPATLAELHALPPLERKLLLRHEPELEARLIAEEAQAQEAGAAAAAVPAQQGPVDEPLTTTELDRSGNKFVSAFDGASTLHELEKAITDVTHQHLIDIGTLLGLIRDHEKWTEGETPYTSWGEYLRIRWNWTRQYANRLISLVPVVKVLAPHADREINAGQAQTLLPVYNRHGQDAVLEIWSATPGNRSAASLEKVALSKGYLEVSTQKQVEAKKAIPPQGWLLFEPVLPLIQDVENLRMLAMEEPERGAEMAAAMRRAADEIEEGLRSKRT